MYSMVLMAALTTGTGAPDQGYGYGYGGYGWGGWGGYGLGWSGWTPAYGGYPWGAGPMFGGYAYSPMIYGWGWGSPFVSAGGFANPGMTRSFYYNPAAPAAAARLGIEARIIVHLPPQATLTVDDQPTRQRSSTRIFSTPPLEPGKTYTYTLKAELNRDGHFVSETKKVEVRAGEPSEVTLRFGESSREQLSSPPARSSRPSEERRDNR